MLAYPMTSLLLQEDYRWKLRPIFKPNTNIFFKSFRSGINGWLFSLTMLCIMYTGITQQEYAGYEWDDEFGET